MRIILTGGGTAGHISPAIAIAEEITLRDKNSSILFVGREGGAENGAIISRGFELSTIRIGGFSRKLTFGNLKSFYIAFRSLSRAKEILKSFSPDAVIGTGGYVCWPMLRCAQGLGIPTVMHESNAVAGLTARLLADKCDRVLISYDECRKSFKRQDNVKVVGNPVCSNFSSLSRAAARRRLGIDHGKFLIVSFGGSGGAKRLNDVLVTLMKEYCATSADIAHIHASGRKYFGKIAECEPNLSKGYNDVRLLPYIENMGLMLSAADLVISRSGAMTLSEIAAAGVPAILIPSPNVAGNHQYKNAKAFSDRGAALLIEEDKLSYAILTEKIEKIKESRAVRHSMRAALCELCTPGAKEAIYYEICRVLAENKSN